MRKKRIVLIGLDGVPYGLVDDLAERGTMPNFQAIKKQGSFVKIKAPLPAVSSVSWSSIITGENPGAHGIYGFTDLALNSYNLFFPNFNDLKVSAFWQKHPELKQVVLNVPSTYPVKPMNGVHLAGFVSPNMEEAVFPAKYLPKLQEMKYEIDVDSELAHQDISLFLEDLFQTTESRIAAFRYFWGEIDWDVFWLVFTGSDRLGHFLFDAYVNQNHQYRSAFLRYFQRVDEVIGEITNRLNEEDLLLIFSDHGMTESKANVNVNYFLMENGFLEVDKSRGEFYNQISLKTTAFALDPGRIYLNKKGKYPAGAVEENDLGKVLKELSDVFLRMDFQGQKIIKQVCRQEEIYSGPQLNRAPDLLLVENPGFRLRAGLGKKELFDKDIFTGTHTADDGFLLVKPPQAVDISLANPKVEDIIGIVEKAII
ncbi:hypothetical protein COT20_01010 [bacterium (Candidatus Gribaldobacteria) CG08_land_8_20_14_0_20_39_15]|uniref:Phosphodiesterase n=1 Tax=bacterium (Candidatus Gribaldobacteria) CG08_land_8_20_14_0_20_39_15 TaxID=2014273 RepID=A0A2M6XUT4_9BACT|nr:MAG: hypothetical protein COT20_01010 [bacterium (Candidatus Gribaldobacteria) CG08_land_8_20_14_0_20_39_15]